MRVTVGRSAAILLASTMLATASVAQEAPPPSPAPSPADAPAATGASGEPNILDEIVVTGTTSRNRTILTSSADVTIATAQDLERRAPRSTAQALELVPGIFVEASGGEVSNNFSVRGLAGGGQQFVQLSEDSLPIFYTDALSDTILKQEISVDRLEAVRGGTSGILTVNGAGATINFITRKPDFDKPAGSFRLTGSSFSTKRVDAFYTAPIADGLAASVGGFFRSSDSVRDTRFTADEGYLVRGAISKKLPGGQFTINVKHVNDHNTFLTPIPLQNSSDPQGVPGLNPASGTLIGPDVSAFTVRTSPTTGALTKDINLRDGVHTVSTSVGYDFSNDFGGVTVFARGRYTDFKNDFNANFSYDNASLQKAVDRLSPTNPTTALLLNRFAAAGANRAALRVVGTGEIIDGATALNALNGNGLVTENVTANNITRAKEFGSDTGLTWAAEGDGFANSLTVGALYFHVKRSDNNIGASTFLSDVRDNSRRLDVVALNAGGQVVGQLTENGLINYGTFGEGTNRSKLDSISIYANDELKIGDNLRIDGGVRYEHSKLRRFEGIAAPVVRSTTDPANPNSIVNIGSPIPGAFDAAGNDVDTIIANNYYAQFGGGSFSGNFTPQRRTLNKVVYTVGANYLITPRLAVYGRWATGFQNQQQNKPTDLNFGEGGIRYQSRLFSASATGFYTKFKDYLLSRQVGTDATITFISSDINVYGAEFDLRVQPTDWFRVVANGVVQKSKISGGQFDGNSPERTPPVNVTITPSIVLPDGRGEVFVSYKRLGRIYSDPANTIRLPGYGVLSAGLVATIAPQIRFALNVDNITNEIGLTEGNPRAGFAENTGGDYFFARPILGRNAVGSLTFDF